MNENKSRKSNGLNKIKWLDLNNSLGISSGKYAFVTINPERESARFYISSKAVSIIRENFGKDNFDMIRIGININDKKMAIKPLKEYETGALSVYYSKDEERVNNTRSFSSKTLMDKIRTMIPNKKTRFSVKWRKDIGALVVNLNEEIDSKKK